MFLINKCLFFQKIASKTLLLSDHHHYHFNHQYNHHDYYHHCYRYPLLLTPLSRL